jgi:hypothetical protein
METTTLKTLVLLIVFINISDRIEYSEAHGRMLNPPGRGSMWRFGNFIEIKSKLYFHLKI